jgi:flagellar secretion chaperone FliS
MNQLAAQEYQLTRIQTGSPVRLVSMLYDGALRFIAEARVAIQAQDIPTRADRVHRATRIIQELRNALEYSVDSDIPHQLAALYDYVEYELVEATTQNQVLPLDNASRVLKELSDAWNSLAEQNVAAQGASASAQESSSPPGTNPSYDAEESSERVPLTLTA